MGDNGGRSHNVKSGGSPADDTVTREDIYTNYARDESEEYGDAGAAENERMGAFTRLLTGQYDDMAIG